MVVFVDNDTNSNICWLFVDFITEISLLCAELLLNCMSDDASKLEIQQLSSNFIAPPLDSFYMENKLIGNKILIILLTSTIYILNNLTYSNILTICRVIAEEDASIETCEIAKIRVFNQRYCSASLLWMKKWQ